MPLDFSIGKSKSTNAFPELFGQILDKEYKIVFIFLEKYNHQIFTKLSNFYNDQKFSNIEIEIGLELFFDTVKRVRNEDEKALLYKLISIFSYAQKNQQEIFTIAD